MFVYLFVYLYVTSKSFPAKRVWVSPSQIARRSGSKISKRKSPPRFQFRLLNIFSLRHPNRILNKGFPVKPVFRLRFNCVQATITVLKGRRQLPDKTVLFRSSIVFFSCLLQHWGSTRILILKFKISIILSYFGSTWEISGTTFEKWIFWFWRF